MLIGAHDAAAYRDYQGRGQGQGIGQGQDKSRGQGYIQGWYMFKLLNISIFNINFLNFVVEFWPLAGIEDLSCFISYLVYRKLYSSPFT